MRARRHSRSTLIKSILLVVIAAISALVIGVLLSSMQTRLYVDSYVQEMQATFDEVPDMLEAANEDVEQCTEIFDQTYQSLAESVSFIANTQENFKINHGTMEELKELFDVNNVLIVNRDGTIEAKAGGSYADFSSSRFNQLRTVFDDQLPAEPVEIELTDKNWCLRYYSAYLDEDRMVVIEQSPDALRELIEESGSMRSTLENVDIGESGYIFSVSARDYTIQYHPNEDLIGHDLLDLGVDVEDLEDGTFTTMEINGESLYCGVLELDHVYYIAAVPMSDMAATRNLTVAVIMIAFIAVIFVVIMYGIFVMRENDQPDAQRAHVRKMGPIRINASIAQKASVLSVAGLLAVVVVSFYMQTLFALSSESVTNNETLEDIASDISDANDHADLLSEEYGDRYLPTCLSIAYILDHQDDPVTRNELQDMADMLNVQSVYVYNSAGEVTMTTASYTNFVLSDDPEDQSYEFLKILQGDADYVVQEPQPDDASGDLWQYIGAPLHNSHGLVNGLVQIGVRPIFLENIVESGSIDRILQNLKVKYGGFAFAIDKEDDTFVYYGKNADRVGDVATEHGIKQSQIKDGFNDYLTIDETKYYASSIETNDYYIFLAGVQGEMMSERGILTFAVGIVAFFCILLIYLIMVWEPGRRTEEPDSGEENASRTMDTQMPDGRTIRTESAASRWLNRSYKWNEKSAWQKMVTVLRWVVMALMVIVCGAVIFQNQIFDSDSIIAYILSNKWERGLNIFALTACIMFLCVALTLISIAQRAIEILSRVLSARGETICRMLSSFIRYAGLIGLIYYCLLLVGVDGTTLLASAGVLSLAISFGARELVTDILSGLFIIIEGEFRVGDIIMIDDWRGTVLEIGIRTTKVEDPNQNVKIFRNGDINDVINMTRELSLLVCDFSLEYSESLERVESILSKELPNMRERLPAIADGPYYRGVSKLSENGINIRITMECREGERVQLERDFNREMKLIFDQYGINIPYPQVVVHEPTAKLAATESEKEDARQFHEQQKAAAKDYGGGNDGQ